MIQEQTSTEVVPVVLVHS